jgi:RHS repeat-associated protein
MLRSRADGRSGARPAAFGSFHRSAATPAKPTDAVGNLLERYTYSAFGTPTFYNAAGISQSALGVRHLFQGQLWTHETGLNDYRNRVELPVMGVFLQPDPIGFKGDAANIYRFCNNNAVNRIDPMGLIDKNASDRFWQMACFMDSGNSFQGSFAELMQKLEPAGTDGGRGDGGDGGGGRGRGDGGARTEGQKMRFVPVKLFDDKKTAKPSEGGDKSGDFYDYQLRDSAGHRVSGVGYTVQEKLELVPDVPNNHDVTKKDEKPRALGSNGIYHDYVGHWTRPSTDLNGYTSVVYQAFQLKYNGSPVEVSTRLVHEVRVINGEVVRKVYIDRP